MNIQGLIIDPQRDFCDPTTGTLYVSGADGDMHRLAQMLNRIGGQVDALHVTLDMHHPLHIAHPLWWQDTNQKHPQPFSIITLADVEGGHWTTTDPTALERSKTYVATLARNERYPLCIWPYHCLIGTPGQAVQAELANALAAWEEKRLAPVDYVVKGQNIWTEHYSAIAADVPDETDPGTAPNHRLIAALRQADTIFVAGEAGSHCVANTVRDLAAFWKADTGNDQILQKVVLLTDALSPVPGFESYQEQFLQEMTARGVRCATTGEFADEIAG
jgi:nicotinamidase-related amidase